MITSAQCTHKQQQIYNKYSNTNKACLNCHLQPCQIFLAARSLHTKDLPARYTACLRLHPWGVSDGTISPGLHKSVNWQHTKFNVLQLQLCFKFGDRISCMTILSFLDPLYWSLLNEVVSEVSIHQQAPTQSWPTLCLLYGCHSYIVVAKMQ